MENHFITDADAHTDVGGFGCFICQFSGVFVFFFLYNEGYTFLFNPQSNFRYDIFGYTVFGVEDVNHRFWCVKTGIHDYSPSQYASTSPVATAFLGPSQPRMFARPATIE